jgi:hypothetical protein
MSQRQHDDSVSSAQLVHRTQIRRNYDGGLRLLVAIATHNRGADYLASKVKIPKHKSALSQKSLKGRWSNDLVENLIDHTTISKYELDKNEPPLSLSCSPMCASQEFPLNEPLWQPKFPPPGARAFCSRARRRDRRVPSAALGPARLRSTQVE